MDEFKEENNFKRCLKKMDLSNVIEAVDRARENHAEKSRKWILLCINIRVSVF